MSEDTPEPAVSTRAYVKVFCHRFPSLEHPNLIRGPGIGLPLGLFFFFDLASLPAFRASLQTAREARMWLANTYGVTAKIAIWNGHTMACDDDGASKAGFAAFAGSVLLAASMA